MPIAAAVVSVLLEPVSIAWRSVIALAAGQVVQAGLDHRRLEQAAGQRSRPGRELQRGMDRDRADVGR